jgi:hypothetical protein
MYYETHTVTITTDVAQAGIGYTPPVRGRIVQIAYEKTDFADGVDFDVTLETSGVVVWDQDNVNASVAILPRQATHKTDGSAAEYANTYPVLEPIYVGDERIKIAVANGGQVKTGTFHIVLG